MDITTIQKRISLIEKGKKEISDAKEMLKGELENDPAYVEAAQEAETANAKKKRLKEEILGRGSNQKLASEVKANTEEVALLKEILSAELMEVYKEEGKDEIADADGDSRKFKIVVNLLPKGAKVQDRDSLGKYKEDLS
jgi:hypothetical protein